VTRSAISSQPLPELLEQLRAKGVRQGVGPMAGETAERATPGVRGAISSGFPALDTALRTDGWPRGALALLAAGLAAEGSPYLDVIRAVRATLDEGVRL